MNQDLSSIGDVSRKIGIARHKIEYAIVNGSILEPKIRIANKRAFNESEVNTIAKYFGKTIEVGNTDEGVENEATL